MLIPDVHKIPSDSTKGVELEANIWKDMLRMFALMGRKGLPVVIKNGFEGTNFDATALRHLLISMNLSVFLHLSLLILSVSCFGFLRSSRVFGSVFLFVAKVIEDPAKWSCDAIAKRFPSGRMKMEYTATEGDFFHRTGNYGTVYCVLEIHFGWEAVKITPLA